MSFDDDGALDTVHPTRLVEEGRAVIRVSGTLHRLPVSKTVEEAIEELFADVFLDFRYLDYVGGW